MIPSLSHLAHGSSRAALRFPLPLVCAVASTVELVRLQRDHFSDDSNRTLLLTALLGLPLGAGLSLLSERPPERLSKVRGLKGLSLGFGVVLLLAHWALLQGQPLNEAYAYRYAQLSLFAHCFVAFAPFLARGHTNGFWQFNRHLFLRFLLSAVYSGVVFAGLALALAAVDQLFEVKIRSHWYFDLWIVTAVLFQTWHFLGGLPDDLAELDRDTSYPKGLRIFSQYVLLPLLLLYLLILYGYAIKILLVGKWPEGWVGWMVSAACTFGMLALLLLFPVRDKPEGRFVRVLEVGFHVAIIPLVVLLFASLSRRVGDYGITEKRYFLGVLGTWLLAASVYRLAISRETIKWIPMSLAAVSLFTAWGPWSAVSVSRESQLDRLAALLEKHHVTTGPNPDKNAQIPGKDLHEMSRTIDYLVDTHGIEALARFPSPSGLALKEDALDKRPLAPYREQGHQVGAQFLGARGLSYTDRWSGSSELHFYSSRSTEFEVTGYDYFVSFNVHDRDDSEPLDVARFRAKLSDTRTLEIHDNGTLVLAVPLTEMLKALVQKHSGGGEVDVRLMTVESSNEEYGVRVVFDSLSADHKVDGWVLVHGNGSLVLKKLR